MKSGSFCVFSNHSLDEVIKSLRYLFSGCSIKLTLSCSFSYLYNENWYPQTCMLTPAILDFRIFSNLSYAKHRINLIIVFRDQIVRFLTFFPLDESWSSTIEHFSFFQKKVPFNKIKLGSMERISILLSYSQLIAFDGISNIIVIHHGVRILLSKFEF